ncbi:alpha-2-macroglobulin-like protein, partial [Plakobranchus ocellatus]
GFILTMPVVMRNNTMTRYCVIPYEIGAIVRFLSLTIKGVRSDYHENIFHGGLIAGRLNCKRFLAPPRPGDYKMTITERGNSLRDPVKFVVIDGHLTLIHTDKPQYQPGKKVRFRVLTLFPSLIPKSVQIHSVHIKDPNDVTVKQYLDLATRGIESLDFQLDKEAMLGNWKIEVNNGKEVKATESFSVKGHGRVCGRYLSGKPVEGYLSLTFCWHAPRPPESCYSETRRIHGCYNFVHHARTVRNANYYFVRMVANITDVKTGITLTQRYPGQKERTQETLKIRLDDYSNGFIKPGLPFLGKVTVTKLDGTPASREKIVVTGIIRDISFYKFSKEFTTDESGEIEFALCGNLTEVINVKISAHSTRFEIPGNEHEEELWKKMIMNKFKSFRSNIRYVRQWFSPSMSFIQLPGNHAPLECNREVSFVVLCTARAKSDLNVVYQVMARGKIMMDREVDPKDIAKVDSEKVRPALHLCLRKVRSPSHRETRDDGITEPGRGPFPKTEDEQIHKRDDVIEPIVRSPDISDTVFSFTIKFRIRRGMSPMFTLLVYDMRKDGEVVAESMKYNVKPCFKHEVKLGFKETQAFPHQKVHLKLEALSGSVCSIGVVDKNIPQISPVNIFDKIGEYTNTWYGLNTPLYEDDYKHCLGRMSKIEGGVVPGDQRWQYSSKYVDALEAFKIPGSLVVTDIDLESRPCRRLEKYSNLDRRRGTNLGTQCGLERHIGWTSETLAGKKEIEAGLESQRLDKRTETGRERLERLDWRERDWRHRDWSRDTELHKT